MSVSEEFSTDKVVKNKVIIFEKKVKTTIEGKCCYKSQLSYVL